jgi:hypothetical protein
MREVNTAQCRAKTWQTQANLEEFGSKLIWRSKKKPTALTNLIWLNWTFFHINLALFPKEVFPDVNDLSEFAWFSENEIGDWAGIEDLPVLCSG